MVQFGRPISDIATNSWTAAPLWSKLDEVSFSDADFVESANNANTTAEIALSALGDPNSGAGHVVRYRYAISATGGNSRDITVQLYQGGTLIAAGTTRTPTATAYAADSFTLTAGEADAITSYADLRLRLVAGGTTGGGPSGRRSVRVSWAELEVPDAATPFERPVPAAVSVAFRRAVPAAVSLAFRRTVPAAVGVAEPFVRDVPAAVGISGAVLAPGFDHRRGGAALPAIPTAADTAGFNYRRAGEPFPSLTSVAGALDTRVRPVPAEVAIGVLEERRIAGATVAVAVHRQRGIPAALGIMPEPGSNTYGTELYGAGLYGAPAPTLTVPAAVGLLLPPVARPAPASVAVQGVEERSVPAGVAIDFAAVLTVPAAVGVLAGVQFARPTTDVTDGGWTDQAGGTALAAAIDEAAPDDADYVRSATNPAVADVVEIALGPLTDPGTTGGHKIRYRYAKDAPAGVQIDLTVRLMDGATEIAVWTHTDIGATLTSVEQTLTSGEAGAITDYTDLRLRFEAVAP
jgi:hypothetical protein